MEEITDMPNNSYYMASFDIKSLYTNVPIKETINIILDLAFPANDLFQKFDRASFKKLLEITLLDSYFVFNGKLYNQLDGLAMGSPVAPTMANLFLCFNEKVWLQNCPKNFKPVYYRRYMDDTFLLFKEKNHVNLFRDYLNKQHKNIEFTVEYEEDSTLSFLDVNVIKSHNVFTTQTYRKPTFTGQCLNFNSFTSFKYKLNVVQCLLFRAFNINSTYEKLHMELEFIVDFLTNNGFPVNFLYKLI